jgi:hypothetical protein
MLAYFVAVPNILQPFGMFYGPWGSLFRRFGMLNQEKIWQPWLIQMSVCRQQEQPLSEA